MDWQNILVFGIIPAFSVLILFFVRRKLLWLAPLISTALSFVTYMIALGLLWNPAKMVKFFGNYEYKWFLFLALLLQLGIVVALTLIAYLAAYILKRKKSR